MPDFNWTLSWACAANDVNVNRKSKNLTMDSINKVTKITPSSSFVQAFLVSLLLAFGNQLFAQYAPLTQSAALAEIERFVSGKRVLYMAAHPDDENTRLISWLSNALDAETTYL